MKYEIPRVVGRTVLVILVRSANLPLGRFGPDRSIRFGGRSPNFGAVLLEVGAHAADGLEQL